MGDKGEVGESGPVRLKDVANRVGLDTSTVSKVLNGKAISVREDTRKRILRAASELGYRPNAQARGLRLRSSGAFGVLLPDITNPVYALIVRGAVQRASEVGVSLLLAEASGASMEQSYERLVLEKRIDGLMVATSRSSSTLAERLVSDSIPHVFVNRRAQSEAPSIVVNDEQGARLALETLAQLGHRRIGMLAGPKDIDTAERRLVGFRQGVAERQLEAPVVVRTDFTAKGGYEGMTRIMSMKRRPTAVFASNFLMGLGALKAASDRGIKVPNMVSLIAFDDDAIAPFTVPALSSIRMPYEELGSLAVDSLQRVTRGKECKDVVVPEPRGWFSGSHSPSPSEVRRMSLS